MDRDNYADKGRGLDKPRKANRDNDPDNEAKISDDFKTIAQKIDNTDLEQPELMNMVEFVTNEQAKIAERNNRQLAVFSCVGFAILSILIMLYLANAFLFLIAEVALIVVPAILLLTVRRRANEHT